MSYASVTQGKCSGACFALAATRWISSKLLMVQPGPLVDQAMWVAIKVVLQVLGSRWLGSGAAVARWYSKPRGWVSKLP